MTDLTPEDGLRSLQVVLTLAEEYHAWDLMAATLAYIKEAGGRVLHLAPKEWLIEVSLDDLHGA